MSDRPYVSFAQVKERVSLPEVLEVFGIADQFRRKGDKLTGVCPLPAHHHGPRPNDQQFKIDHKDENSPWLWHCFGDCQRGGDVLEFVKEMTGFDNAHVRFWFAEHFGDRLSLKKPSGGKAGEKKRPAEKAGQSPPPRANVIASESLSSDRLPIKPLRFKLQLEAEAPYLKERGISPATSKRYGLGLCRRGMLSGYLAIPVFGWPGGKDRSPVAYIGRWPGDDYDKDAGRPRYKVPAGFETSRVVYGLAEALEGNDDPLVVVEGPFKVFHLVQCGFPSTVSTLGATLSEEQAEILAATDRQIVLMLDGNEAGREGTRKAIGRLITKTFVRAVKLPEDCEPDGLSSEELRQWLPFVG
ncbi:MAG: toprim domain-containing protein [Planctomycetes bacterium]|nr:toprim domain-containing protein [Planctomycetota bacterium]